jgi:hypothetical protein
LVRSIASWRCAISRGTATTVNVMDQTAVGRQEEWEEPKGRRTEPDTELHYHDEYDL